MPASSRAQHRTDDEHVGLRAEHELRRGNGEQAHRCAEPMLRLVDRRRGARLDGNPVAQKLDGQQEDGNRRQKVQGHRARSSERRSESVPAAATAVPNSTGRSRALGP